MTKRAQLPDGTILEFPDNTPDEVIDGAVKKHLGVSQSSNTKKSAPQEALPGKSQNNENDFDSIPLKDRVGMFSDAFVENAAEQLDPRNLTGENIGDIGIITGATTGARIGSPAGPLGMATGGVLGAMMAAAAKEAAKNSPLEEGATNILREGVMEAGSFGVAKIFDGQLISKGLRSLFGVGTDQAKNISDAARRQGVDLGITDVGNSVAEGSKTVLGVFPFVSQPFVEATARQQTQAMQGVDRILNNIAPNAKLTELGVDMVNAAKNSFNEFRGVASTLYTEADNLASSAGDIVPTQGINDAISDIVARRSRPVTRSGKELKGPSNTELDEYISNLQDLPDNISVAQLRSIQQDIGEFFSQAKSKGFDTVKLSKLKSATEDAMFSLDTSSLSPEDAEKIRKSYETANNFYFENMKRFDNPTARRFGRVDKNIFKPGRDNPGFTNQDEVVSSVFNSKSPQALNDLRSLVGDDAFLKASRQHISNAFKFSVDKDTGNLVFRPGEVKARLGFTGTDDTSAMESLKIMLKGTGQSASDLKEFLDVTENIGKIVVPATMVKRRFILGGISSGLRTFTLGAMGAGAAAEPVSLTVSIPVVYLIRRGAKFLTDPGALRDITRLAKSTTMDEEARAAAIRLLRFSLKDPGERAQEISAPAL